MDALSTISGSGDEDAMLAKLASALRWLVGFTHLEYVRIDDDEGRCRVRTLFDARRDAYQSREESLPATSGPAGALIASGRSWLVSRDADAVPRQSILAVSVANDEHVYGVLVFHTTAPDGFLADEIETARIVSQHLGFAAARSMMTVRLQAEVDRRMMLESDLRCAVDAAEAANRAKDAFLAVVSHELRIPLNTMAGWVAVLRSGRVPADQMTKLLESLERNVRLQTRLVDDLVDASRIVADKLTLIPIEFDLRGAVSDAVDGCRSAAAAAGVRLTVDMPGHDVRYRGDAQRLQQVLANLLSNAIKFSSTPGQEVEIRMERTATGVRISVRDDGRGIEPDFLPFMFEPFRQQVGPSTRTEGGLGLGLTIARHIIELHHGTIRAESAGKGRGAMMIVELPLP